MQNQTKGLNSDLLSSNLQYEQQNLQLQSINLDFQASNNRLNSTIFQLNQKVDVLEDIEQNLTITVDKYQLRNQELTSEVDSLSNITLDLNGRVVDLNVQVVLLQEENDNYAQLNRDLGTIVSFLNDTSLGFQQTFESLSSSLATQITTRRNLLVEDLHLKYSTNALHWDCDVDSRFRLRDFAKDDTLPIGSEYYDEVIQYLDEELLGEVCINTEDLELFLSSNVLPVNATLESISLVDLKSGVSKYTGDVFNYYFPDEGEEGGLSEQDWSEADYDCEKLPSDKLFYFSNI